MKVYPILHPELLIIDYQNQILLLDTGGSNSLAKDSSIVFEDTQLLASFENQLLSKMIFPTVKTMIKKTLGFEIDGLVGIDILKYFYVISDLKKGIVGISRHQPNCHFNPIESSYLSFLTLDIPAFHFYINGQAYQAIYDTGAHIGFSISPSLKNQGTISEIINDFSPLIGSFQAQSYLYQAQIKSLNASKTYPLDQVCIADVNQITVDDPITMPLLGSGADLIKAQIKLLNSEIVIGSAIAQQYPLTTLPIQENTNAPAIAVIESNHVHDHFAKHYDQSYADIFGHDYENVTQNLVKDLRKHLHQGQRFLDVGAGTGRISLALKDLCACTLVEPSIAMLNQAIQKYENLRKSSKNETRYPTDFYFGPLDEKFEDSYENTKFDMIFLGMGVVDYLTDQELQTLQEVACRLLATNGYLVIQPTPTQYFIDTTLVGHQYERTMQFINFPSQDTQGKNQGTQSFQLKHQIKVKSTGEIINEDLTFYQREKTLKQDLSLFKHVQSSYDGSYYSLYFQIL